MSEWIDLNRYLPPLMVRKGFWKSPPLLMLDKTWGVVVGYAMIVVDCDELAILKWYGLNFTGEHVMNEVTHWFLIPPPPINEEND